MIILKIKINWQIEKSGNMQDVVVLMSTYNGELYIREQLESIRNQKDVTVQIIVRDDGSSDGTIAILEEYEKQGQLKFVKGKNAGVGSSFMQLLYHAPKASYYAFADQDDIWQEDKLSAAISMITKKTGPVLYTSNQMLVDKEGKELELRFKKKPGLGLFQVIDRSWLSGCTMVMNRRLFEILVEEDRRPSRKLLLKKIHDVWVLMAAICIGTVLYDEDAHILYRQHDNNVIGVRKMTVGQKITLYLNVLTGKKEGRLRSWTAKELQRCFGDLAVGENKEILQLLSDLDSVKGKWQFCRSRYPKQVLGSSLLFYLKVWLNQV